MHRFLKPITLGCSTIALVTLLAVSPSVAQQSSSSEEISDQIDDLLRPVAEADLFSGVVLVARGDTILYHEPLGYANWELDVPATRATRFGIASITKAMTEVIVELLVREGRLNLDTPVQQYIAGFPRGPEGGIPTIGHLYTHRSGVPHRVTDDVEEAQALHAADIVERVKQAGLLFEPGAERLYSSAGFTVLARVIELVEGKPFEHVLEERIFAPAGMDDAISETGRQLMKRRAYPYYLGTDQQGITVTNAACKDLRFLTGAGSVFSTAEDLFQFLRAMHDGVFGTELWDQAVDADATTWRGWAGRTSGYEAYMDVLPAEDLTLIMVTNLRSVANWQARAAIQALLIGAPSEAIERPPPMVEPFEPFASVVGVYDRNGSLVEIQLQDDTLFRGDNEFYPIAGQRYYIPASGTVMAFRRDARGEVDALLSPPDNEDAILLRVR